jgi:3,4-dihydroxy 2-butanone 4-phosphate synthase/GTP cyclohydrolase II
VSEAPLPTRYGTAKAILFGSNVSPTRHLVVQVGEPRVDEPVAVRVHVASLLEDVFHGEKGENTIDVDAAVRTLWAQGGGILLYLYADGTHASPLDAYLSAYAHQAQHGGTVPQAFARFGIRRDPKDFGIGAQILTSLGLKQIRLLSNSPKGLRGLESYGLTVVDYLPVEP